MRQRGFSLIEMLVAVALFVLISGAAFKLLNASQQRFAIESQVLDSFQTARLAMDQMIRDIHSAGYPPISSLPCTAAALVAQNNPTKVAYPFAWDVGYADPVCPPPNPPIGCTVGATCGNPNGYDLIMETDLDPQNNNGVEWVRYSLRGTTLFRAVVSKVAGGSPATATQAALQPYLENVVNNAPAATIAAIRASYPSMFPGGNPVPVFQYNWRSGSSLQIPQRIRGVNITLIVMAPNPDPATRQRRVVELTGLAQRVNPN